MELHSYFLSLFLITSLFSTSSAIVPSEDYSNKVELLPNEEYVIFWKFDEEYITFEVHAQTTGWVGFGLSPNGGMAGSDMVIGWVPPDGGKAVLTDRHATGESEPIVDDVQNYQLLEGKKDNVFTMLKFKRKLVLCDKDDITITDNTHKIVWALGSTDGDSNGNIQKHYAKGSKSMLFFSLSGRSQTKPVPNTYLDVLNTNITIPSQETSYWCRIMKLNPQNTKKHVFMFEPIIKEENVAVVHHIVMYGCYGNIPDSAHNHQWDCGLERMPDNYTDGSYHCEASLFGWAVGGEEFWFPENVGFPWYDKSGHSPTYVRLETHYDNQEQRTGLIDDSGLRLWMTDTLRPNEAAVVRFGMGPHNLHQIPPHAEGFVSHGHCSSSCTEKAMENQPTGITIFASFLHTHLLGRKIYVHHYRNNTELPMISKDEHYDFDYQETRGLSKHVVMKPGDSVRVNCVYDSTGRTESTEGGAETKDEMCMAYIYYYPAINLATCESVPEIDQSLKAFDLEVSNGYVTTPGAYHGMYRYQALMGAIGSTNWKNKKTRNKFQKAVTEAGGSIRSKCFGYTGNLFGAEHGSYKVLKVPDYKSVTAPPDPCEVNAAMNAKTTLSTFIAILATNIFLVGIHF